MFRFPQIFFLILIFCSFFPLFAETQVEKIRVYGKRSLKSLPESSTEFSGEAISASELQKHKSFSEALRAQPSVLAKESASDNGPVLQFRGLDPIQNRHFLERVSLSDAEYNAENLAQVPYEALRRVEIFPEGVPVSFGSDGLGGATDLKLESPESPARLGARVGSFGYAKAFGAAPILFDKSRIHIEYAQSNEDFSYFDDQGTPFNPDNFQIASRKRNGFRRVSLLPQATLFQSSTASLRIFNLTTFRTAGVPGSIRLPLEGDWKGAHSLTSLSYEGKGEQEWKTNFHIFIRGSFDEFVMSKPSAALRIENNRSKDLTGGGRVRVSYRGHELTSGGQWESFELAPERSPQLHAERMEIPVGISSEIEWNDLKVHPAVLTHFYRYQSSNRSKELGLVSPRLGITYEMAANVTLRGAVGSYYRAPSLYELYGAPVGLVANVALLPERAVKAELGADTRWDYSSTLKSLRLSYTFAISRAENLISFLQNSQDSRVATNIGKSLIQSHEAGIHADFANDFHSQSSLNLMSAKNRSLISYQNGKDVPFRPSYRLFQQISWEPNSWEFGYRFSWLGPMALDLINQTNLASVMEHSAYLGWNSREFGRFSFEAQNLGNVLTASATAGAYQTVENTSGTLGYPAPGRRFYFNWRYEL